MNEDGAELCGNSTDLLYRFFRANLSFIDYPHLKSSNTLIAYWRKLLMRTLPLFLSLAFALLTTAAVGAEAEKYEVGITGMT